MKFFELFVFILCICIAPFKSHSRCDAKPDIEIVTPPRCDGTKGIIRIIVPEDWDISENEFILLNNNQTELYWSKVGETTITGFPPGNYVLLSNGITCDGENVLIYEEVTITTSGLDTGNTFGYICKGSSIAEVSTVCAGDYVYSLWSGNTKLDSAVGKEKEILTFKTDVIKSEYILKVSDPRCDAVQEFSYTVAVTDYNKVSGIRGDADLCIGSTLKLSTEIEAGSYKWIFEGKTVSTARTLEISNITASNSGTYTLEIPLPNCVYTETIDVKIKSLPSLNVAAVSFCLNSGVKSLNGLVSPLKPEYKLIWFDNGQELSGAPSVTTDLIKTVKFQVAQEDAAGCRSERSDVTVAVEDLPRPIDASSVKICLDPSNPKPSIIIINAGNGKKYNLYAEYSGGAPIGTGIAIDDTARIETSSVLQTGYYFIETSIGECVSDSRTGIQIDAPKTLIKGDINICAGAGLKLESIYPADRNIWTKPDGTTFTGSVLSISDLQKTDQGTYKLHVEQNIGCVMNDRAEVSIKFVPAPVPEKSEYNYCKDQDSKPVKADVVAGYSLVWFAGNDTELNLDTPPGTGPAPSTAAVGTTVYKVAYEDSEGCRGPKTEIKVIVGSPTEPVKSSDLSVCIGEKPVITISNAIVDNIYNLYDASGELIGSTTATGTSVSIQGKTEIENTVYSVTVVSPNGCESATTSVNVVSIKKLIDPSSITGTCAGVGIVLKAVDISGATYSWTLPDGSTKDGKSITVDDPRSGKYILTVKFANCDDVTADVIVSVDEVPAPTVNVTEYEYCPASTARPMTAAAASGNTLLWYDNAGNVITSGTDPVQSPTPSTSKSGTFVYKVSQKNEAGCESPKVEVKVIVSESIPDIPTSDIRACIAQRPVINISNTSADYTYAIYLSDSGGNIISSKQGNGSEISLQGNSEQDNTVYYAARISGAGCESARVPINIIAVSKIIDPSSTTSVCEGKTITLTGVSVNGASYIWKSPSGDIISNYRTVQIHNASPEDAGKYTLILKTGLCDDASTDITVSVGRPPVPKGLDRFDFCVDDASAELTAEAISGCVLIWYDQSGNIVSPIISAAIPGTYVYAVAQAFSDERDCTSDRREVSVTINDMPDTPVIPSFSICAGTAPAVDIPDSQPGYVYYLYDNEYRVKDSVVGNGSTVRLNYGTVLDADQTLFVNVKNMTGCFGPYKAVLVEVTELYIAPEALPLFKKDEYYSTRLTTNASMPEFVKIDGSLPSGMMLSTDGEISGISSVIQPETFTVQVTDNAGCTVQKEYVLKGEMIIVEIFSPNGDGINDHFMKGYHVVIFDRFGTKLFEGDDGWDGTRNGSMMPADTYYYILDYTDDNGKNQRVSGSVLILKR